MHNSANIEVGKWEIKSHKITNISFDTNTEHTTLSNFDILSAIMLEYGYKYMIHSLSYIKRFEFDIYMTILNDIS